MEYNSMSLSDGIALLDNLRQTRDGKSHIGPQCFRIRVECLNRTRSEVPNLPRVASVGKQDEPALMLLTDSTYVEKNFIDRRKRAVDFDEERRLFFQTEVLKTIECSNGTAIK